MDSIDSICVLHVGAENDGLAGGKVGGIGDVMRDAPAALALLGRHAADVRTVVPSYGFLHRGGKQVATFVSRAFGGQPEEVELFQVSGRRDVPGLTHFVLHHHAFEFIDPRTGQHRIYCDGPPERPFATDASKFARFCAAVAEGLTTGVFGHVNRLHLHDWHAAFVFILRRFDPTFRRLRTLRTVYTIHNLALQGVRPLRDDPSSLEAWYPQLKLMPHEEVLLTDPEYQACVNPMAVGVRFADAVHTVSPGYKDEIVLPSRPHRGDPDCESYGGEGLEQDLRNAEAHGLLFGILNGCEYDDRVMPRRDEAAFRRFLLPARDAVRNWMARAPDTAHQLALLRLDGMLRRDAWRPAVLVTCVTRLVSQKARLMQLPKGSPSLARILGAIGDQGLCIVLGTGDPLFEQFMLSASESYPNLLFLKGFDVACASALYANGDLFLMPSSFEPCGISQMLAMRDGQPCVVHGVGGLRDTVEEGRTGFTFSGTTVNEQAEHFAHATLRAITQLRADPDGFERLRDAAFRERFLWSVSVGKYMTDLYNTKVIAD